MNVNCVIEIDLENNPELKKALDETGRLVKAHNNFMKKYNYFSKNPRNWSTRKLAKFHKEEYAKAERLRRDEDDVMFQLLTILGSGKLNIKTQEDTPHSVSSEWMAHLNYIRDKIQLLRQSQYILDAAISEVVVGHRYLKIRRSGNISLAIALFALAITIGFGVFAWTHTANPVTKIICMPLIVQ